ncbi:bile acid:sodium symporter family protein [Nocardia sp. NPDC004582]
MIPILQQRLRTARLPGWLDPFVAFLMLTLVVAALLPPVGRTAAALNEARGIVIGFVFFSAGLRLSPTATWAGLRAWRLHGATLAMTFVVFPVLTALFGVLAGHWLNRDLVTGLLFLGALPSVVQTSVAFTAMARGNTAAALCGASLSSLGGVLVTPLLVLVSIGSYAGIGFEQFGQITVQLLLPFAAGQLLHARLRDWAARNAFALRWIDRGSVLMIVYSAFGAAVAGGIWHRLPAPQLALVAVVCAALLAIALTLTNFGAKALGFDREDRVVMVFCGSEKSLTIGLPLSAILFTTPLSGVVIIPVIIYHQLQLIVCSVLARRL